MSMKNGHWISSSLLVVLIDELHICFFAMPDELEDYSWQL